MGRVFWMIYIQPLHRIIIFMAFMVIFWGIFGKKGKNKQWWCIINAVVFVCAVLIILYMTIYSRSEAAKEAILIPFHSFIQAKEQPELYRSMLMNIFLFVPIGLSLPFVLSKKKHSIIMTMITAFLFSASIEAIQYYFALGLCEVDDVIMNTLGAMIGALAYFLSSRS